MNHLIEPEQLKEELMAVLHTTQSDIVSQMKQAKINCNEISSQVQFMQGKVSQVMTRQVLNSVMMAVMSKKTDASMTQK